MDQVTWQHMTLEKDGLKTTDTSEPGNIMANRIHNSRNLIFWRKYAKIGYKLELN